MSRAERNNNPGNIVYNKRNNWEGAADPPFDVGGYCRFITVPYGVRAMYGLLLTYRDRYNRRTIESIVNKWAPIEGCRKVPGHIPALCERNKTEEYIAYVSERTGWHKKQEIEYTHENMVSLIRAMEHFESGKNWVTDKEMDAGLAMLGLKPLRRKSRTVTGGAIGIGATAGTVMEFFSDWIDEAGGFVSQIAPYLDAGTIKVFIVLSLVSAVLIPQYAYRDDQRRGIRP